MPVSQSACLLHQHAPRTTTKRDPLALRRRPARHRRAADRVAETDHARDCLPAVLAKPSVRPAAAGTCARAAVRCACVRVGVGEAEAREDRRSAVGVREHEDVGECVDVRRRGGLEVARVLCI